MQLTDVLRGGRQCDEDGTEIIMSRQACCEAADEIERLRADLEDKADIVSKALRRAWHLGQTYWQQADSESWSQNKKADETQARFQQLVDETRTAIVETPNWCYTTHPVAQLRHEAWKDPP